MPEDKKQNQNSYEDIATIAAKAAAEAIKNASSEEITNANSAALKINSKIKEKQIAQQNYASRIANEMRAGINCCTISIPEMYKKWQPSFTVSINGCTVNIPADGKQYTVHNDFAILIMRRMKRLSYKIAHLNDNDVSEYNRY